MEIKKKGIKRRRKTNQSIEGTKKRGDRFLKISSKKKKKKREAQIEIENNR